MPEKSKVVERNAVELQEYRSELEQELNAIVDYWQKYVIDPRDGFYGKVNDDNTPDTFASKGVVLNSRILWTFSSIYRFNSNPVSLALAQRAFEYLVNHFFDPQNGGVYWTVDSNGQILDGKKQIYGLAFCIYGLSAYFQATGEKEALERAKSLYNDIELHSRDKEKGGYLEAFTTEWMLLEDLRLSPKDSNEKKSMNTHLHILEAYSQLYSVWPDKELKENIIALIRNFIAHIVDPKTAHLHLFFNEDWNVRGEIISYGHDIEAAWLLLEAAETIEDKELVEVLKANSTKMVLAAEEGLDSDGGLWYELENGHLVKEKHSWPQAEAMVGFFNSFQVTGEERYLQLSLNSWDFAKRHIIDSSNGEWHWGIDANHRPMKGMDKVGIWKCPYHNSRACMQIIARIDSFS